MLAAGAVAGLAFAGPALRAVSDPDVWWHLKAGRELLAGHPDAFVESWSFTAAGRPWINHEWLAEAFFATSRRVGGDTGVVVFAALVVLLAALLLFRAALREGCPPVLAALGIAFAACVAGSRFLPRPHVFTYLLLALWLERASAWRIAEKPPGRAPFVILPLIQILWTNLHGPIPGLVMGSLIALGALPWLDLKRRLLLVFLLALASFVHPQGPRALFEYIPHLLGGNNLYKQTILEWRPLISSTESRFYEAPATWACVVLATLAATLCLLNRKSRGLSGLALLLLGLAVAPLFAVRHRDLLAMALTPVLAAIRGRIRGPGGPSRWKAAATTGAFVSAGLLLAIPGLGLLGYPRAWPPTPKLLENDYPVAAVSFLQSQPVGSKIFNAYDYGGYLVERLAPERRVFIDGRYFVYGESVYAQYLEARDGGPTARAILDRHGADLLVVRYPEADGYQGLATLAREWPDWHLIFWDDMTLIYARATDASAEWLAAHAYSAFDPTLPPPLQDPTYWRDHFQDIVREADRAAKHAPDAIRPILVQALAFEYNGANDRAARFYKHILFRHPGNRPAAEGLARVSDRGPRSMTLPLPGAEQETLRTEPQPERQ